LLLFTGKTAIGAQIAYLFSLVNKKLGDFSGGKRKAKLAQVLYCGPSNKSVDVVAGKTFVRYRRCVILSSLHTLITILPFCVFYTLT
jgi:hypothetical protein